MTHATVTAAAMLRVDVSLELQLTSPNANRVPYGVQANEGLGSWLRWEAQVEQDDLGSRVIR